MPEFSVMVSRQSSLTILRTSSTFFVCATCRGTTWTLRIFYRSTPCFNWENHSKVCVLPMAMTP
jgi:hypothetical protein